MFGKRTTERGQRRGYGFGFQGSVPPYPYVGRGRGGLPRCQYPGNTVNTRNNYSTNTITGMAYEQEIESLNNRAEQIKQELSNIESRIRDLKADEKE